jgi:hypothetical protein
MIRIIYQILKQNRLFLESLLMALSADAHLSEGQVQHLKSTLNKISEVLSPHAKPNSF